MHLSTVGGHTLRFTLLDVEMESRCTEVSSFLEDFGCTLKNKGVKSVSSLLALHNGTRLSVIDSVGKDKVVKRPAALKLIGLKLISFTT